MRIERRYTSAGQSPYAAIPFRSAVSEIKNPDGSVVFRLEGIEVPEAWSQVASRTRIFDWAFQKPRATKLSADETRSTTSPSLGVPSTRSMAPA